MADDTTPLVQFEDYVADIQDWLTDTAKAASDQESERDWCTLKMTESITEDSLETYFDRSALSEKYAEEYKKNPTDENLSTTPYAFLQLESDLIFSMHKSFSARHRSRLMKYRDDCANKKYHSFSAISLGLAKYTRIKENVEQKQQTGI